MTKPELTYVIKDPIENCWLGEPYETMYKGNSLYTSRIGGKPTFVEDRHRQNAMYGDKWPKELPKIKEEKLKCGGCGKRLRFIAQIFAPLKDTERFLYVYGCNQPGCKARETSLGWKAFRTQFKSKPEEKKEKKVVVEEKKEEKKPEPEETKAKISEWDEDSDEEEDIEAMLANRNLNEKTEKKQKKKPKKQQQQVQHGICYELDIFEEPTPEEVLEQDPRLQKQIEEYKKIQEEMEKDFPEDDLTDSTSDGAFGFGGDGMRTKHIDKQFLKFQVALDAVPTQSVRWQFKGYPLWVMDKIYPRDYRKNRISNKGKLTKDEILAMSLPKCPRCGGDRGFELQILPTIIYQLKDENLNFGSVYIFTCSGSCAPLEGLTYDECFVHVQPSL